MAVASRPAVGELLREWRARRRLSQLDLALQAGVSQRHLSFVEVGRADPSRDLLVRLAAELDIPLRERNDVLLAAGFAPLYSETPLEADELLPLRHAMSKILTGHEPFPAVIVDRGWDVVWSNEPARALLTDAVSPRLLVPRPNAIRVSLHAEGLAPRIDNFREYAAHLLTRLERQRAAAPDAAVSALYDEVIGYPQVTEARGYHVVEDALLFTPLRLRTAAGQTLSLFSTIATFGTALDITIAELSIESFYPGDKQTDAALRAALS